MASNRCPCVITSYFIGALTSTVPSIERYRSIVLAASIGRASPKTAPTVAGNDGLRVEGDCRSRFERAAELKRELTVQGPRGSSPIRTVRALARTRVPFVAFVFFAEQPVTVRPLR